MWNKNITTNNFNLNKQYSEKKFFFLTSFQMLYLVAFGI